MNFIDWVVFNIVGAANAMAIVIPVGAGYWVNNRFKRRPDAVRYALTAVGVLAALALCSLSASLFGFPYWMPRFL